MYFADNSNLVTSKALEYIIIHPPLSFLYDLFPKVIDKLIIEYASDKIKIFADICDVRNDVIEYSYVCKKCMITILFDIENSTIKYYFSCTNNKIMRLIASENNDNNESQKIMINEYMKIEYYNDNIKCHIHNNLIIAYNTKLHHLCGIEIINYKLFDHIIDILECIITKFQNDINKLSTDEITFLYNSLI